MVGLTLAWCVAQAGLNTLQAGLTAIVPDRTPVRQRGAVSGWVGLTQSVGVVLGVVAVTAVVTGTVSGYLLIAVVVVLTAAPFALATPDPAVSDAPRLHWTTLLTAFRFRPKENPDFAWAWVTRFLVQLGNAMATLYLLYFLRDQVGLEKGADVGLLIVIGVYTVATVLTVVVGGVISDRTGRRKPSVILSGLVMAGAAGLLAFWPTERDRAKDLGVINIANPAPQVLGPALATPIVTKLGGYPALYLAVAVVTVLGSILVTRIRSVA